jgi:adenylate cyclase
VDKFMGDAIMAVFGAPVHSDDYARQALKTALAISAEVDRFREWLVKRFPDRGLPEFEIGIGLQVGEGAGLVSSLSRIETALARW